MEAEKLVAAGAAALKRGDRNRARQLLAQAVQADPGNVAGWLWLSGALDGAEERRFCLERVIQLDPDNEAARRGIAALSAAARLVPPAPEAPSPPADAPAPRPPEPSPHGPPPSPEKTPAISLDAPPQEPPPSPGDVPAPRLPEPPREKAPAISLDAPPQEPLTRPASSRAPAAPLPERQPAAAAGAGAASPDRWRRIPPVALNLPGAASREHLEQMAERLQLLPVTESLRGTIRGEVLEMRGKTEYVFVLQSRDDLVRALTGLERLFVPANRENGERQLVVRHERGEFALKTPVSVVVASLALFGAGLLLAASGGLSLWQGFRAGGGLGIGAGLLTVGAILTVVGGLLLEMSSWAPWVMGLAGAGQIIAATIGLLVGAAGWPLPVFLLGIPLVAAPLLPGTRLFFGNLQHKGGLILDRAGALLLNRMPERAAEWFKLYLYVWREGEAVGEAVEGLARCRMIIKLQSQIEQQRGAARVE